MNNPFDHLDKLLEHRLRLQIMSLLMTHDKVDFTTLKELLSTTDGNLATHLKALEKENYIACDKSFVNRKPLTTYQATPTGTIAFRAHLDALEKVLSSVRPTE